MKISDDDRELAREVADLFGEADDPRTVGALSVILWSHRQRPADVRPPILRPYPSTEAPARVACDRIYDSIDPRRTRCVREAGHPDHHRTLGGFCWFVPGDSMP